MKDKNLEYINKFSNITISRICKKKGLSRQNIYTGKAKPEKIQEVKEEIESEIAKLYIKEEK